MKGQLESQCSGDYGEKGHQMLINRAPPMSLKLPSVLSCFVPTLGLGDSECLLVIGTMVKSREGRNAQMTTPTQSVTRSVKLGLKEVRSRGKGLRRSTVRLLGRRLRRGGGGGAWWWWEGASGCGPDAASRRDCPPGPACHPFSSLGVISPQ